MNPQSETSSQASFAHSQLFTVRVWQEKGDGDQAVWRVKVTHVMSGKTCYFDGWPILVDILRLNPLHQDQLR